MRILILGAQGQLGAELVGTNPGHTLLLHTRLDAEMTDAGALGRFVRAAHPEMVLNTAAFNLTELCEEEPNIAFAVNTLAPRALAGICSGLGARLLHFSTDFVFDGKKGAPYGESDAPNPINVYALSKYGGERFVLSASDQNIVCRTAGLYGRAGSRAKGGNFIHSPFSPAPRRANLFVWSTIFFSRPLPRATLLKKCGNSWRSTPEAGFSTSPTVGDVPGFNWPRPFWKSVAFRCPSPPSLRPNGLEKCAVPPIRLVSERLSSLGLTPLRPWREALTAYLKEQGASL
ncbi:MAG: sugar nucleotide-binding protein [Elusimicrobia bacterium]|nr:sugar nucleotide-binding protein [Elusimicrobiota bacterium]